MKHPAGRSIVWCFAGSLAGMALMAATSTPQPDLRQPLFGVVRPAPEKVYVGYTVYKVPDSCLKMTAQVELYETALSQNSGDLGNIRELVGNMLVSLRAKDGNLLKNQIEQFDQIDNKMYNEAAPDSTPSAQARMYRAQATMELLLKKCQHDIQNQSN